jgi:hypothetical protein
MIRWRPHLLAFVVFGLFWPLHYLTGIQGDLYLFASLSAALVYLGAIRLFGRWQSFHASAVHESEPPR